MSYPFGSGMPPPNAGSYPQSSPYPQRSPYPPESPGGPYSSPSGPYPPQSSPYPPQSSPYPPQSSPYPPQSSPYPPQSSPYPPQSSPYPQQPGTYPHSAPFGSGYSPQGFQPNRGYPTQTGYPSSNPAPYPPASQSYGSGGGASPYPTQGHHSPHPSPYPTQPQYPPPSSFPPSSTNSPYPPQSHAPGGYPTQQPNYGYHQPYAGGGAGAGFHGPPQSFAQSRREKTKGTPTVVPATEFNPVEDAHVLRKAMKGWGTDEDALINVICRRSNEQRQLIEKEYKTNFGKDLIEDLKSETSGNFEKLLCALMTPIVDFYVQELYDAMAGLGTDEDVLIEILCSMSNYEINVIKEAYQRKHGKDLESELMSETSGNFKRLLVSLCAAGRDESGVIDSARACQDATDLLRAGELRVGTDESTFNMVLCQRNYGQLRLICEEYEKMTGHSLEKAIENEFSGDILDGLTAIVQCVSNKSEFFARRLHKSMAGLGTNDSQLIRIIVTRSEIDMLDIKMAFERIFGESLRSWIKGDTSGHYKHALYALIGEERSS